VIDDPGSPFVLDARSAAALDAAGSTGARLAGLLPPLLAALYAAWCGTWIGGASFSGSAGGAAALLAALVAAGAPWRDPLRLRGTGRLLPAALWLAVAASAWSSPVPRAGKVAVLLLPAYLWLPAVVARCWRRDAARRLGLRTLAAVLAGVSLWSLVDWLGLLSAGAPRPAAPLGQHRLLAAWLVTLLPLGLLSVREKAGWRWLGWSAGALAAVAIVATRSLAGWLALVAEALAVLGWLSWRSPAAARRRSAALLALALVVGLALAAALPRVRRIAAGQDPSLRARAVYYRAGWRGFQARPVAGWGPGSAAWTAAAFLDPVPGVHPWSEAAGELASLPVRLPGKFVGPLPSVNPWGEAVGELHSLPVQLAYELGAIGSLLALALVARFASQRLSDLGRLWAAGDGNLSAVAGSLPGNLSGVAGSLPGNLIRVAGSLPGDGALLLAACAGLVGSGVAFLATSALAATALPLAAALAAGAALSAVPPDDGGAVAAGPRLATGIYAAVAALGLVAPEMARLHYDRAAAAAMAGRADQARHDLAGTVRWDPDFPLYRLRLALSMTGSRQVDVAAGRPPGGETRSSDPASLALHAAEEGGDVPALWLAAALLGHAARAPWAIAALERACRLDPFDPFPPFYLLVARPEAAGAGLHGAHALLADPRLAAAVFWEGRQELFERALAEVRRWPGIDAGWKEALLAAMPPAAARRGRGARLDLVLDASAAQSLSLSVFRRLPWPAEWPLIELRGEVLSRLHLPPATGLAEASPADFRRACGRASSGK
jgi:O-antigen ligase